MMFKPFLGLTLITAPVLAVLIWLGVWQIQRAEWKAGLIADYERAISEPAASASTYLCRDEPAAGKVVAKPDTGGKDLRVFGHDAAGDAGWRIFQASRHICPGFPGGVLVENRDTLVEA